MRRYINHGSFGVRGVNRIRLIQSAATGIFLADYRENRGSEKRIRVNLQTDDPEVAKEKVLKLCDELKQKGRVLPHTAIEPVLYVLQRGTDGPIKVGISRQLKNRVSQLQNGNAEQLHVLRIYRMADVERAVHSELEREARLVGEWFPAELLPSVDRFFNVQLDVSLKRAQKRRVRV